MMTHVELGHLVLNLGDACQTGSFFHHLDHTLVFHFGGNVATVLHQFSKANVLNDNLITL